MRMMGLVVLLVATSASAGEPMEVDDLPAPQPEVARNEPKVTLPAVPAFALPIAEPGLHGALELRLHGAALRGTEVKIKGYITSIYDCAAELAASRPRLSRAALLDAVDRDPRQCEQPRFSLADLKGAPPEASVTVVDVPRRPAKPERDGLSPAELARWPKVPTLAVGDCVIVTGTWAIRSPRGAYDGHGLLIYKAIQAAAPAEPDAVRPATAQPAPEIAVVTRAPLRRLVSNPVFNASVAHVNACNQRILAGRYDDAIAACAAAVAAWPGNHLAWYEAASAHIAKREWRQAQAAAERAIAARPDLAMYQLYAGVSLYEAERQRVQDERAAGEHREPADGGPAEATADPSEMKLDAARDALLRATRLGPDLWRAHYYLGRVYRDLDDARSAAEQFSQAIATHPSYLPAYVALIELYRRWAYADQALAVAMLGVAHVSPADARMLWYEAGLALQAKRADDKAIEAFDKAGGGPQDMLARFLRGQAYFRKHRLAEAERELAEVVRSNDPQVAEFQQLAAQLLQQIAHARLLGRPRGNCTRYESCPRDTERVSDDRR